MTFQAASRSYTFDISTQLKDAGLIASSAAAQVSSADKILNVGNSAIFAVAVIDVTAVEIGTGDEHFDIVVQGSTSSTFGSVIENLACLDLGANSSGRFGSAQDSVVGRYEVPFINCQAGVVYPYIRLYTKVAGTIATGINYTAYLGLIPKA